MNKKRVKKYILVAAIAILLSGVLFTVFYSVPFLHIRYLGIELTPSGDIISAEVPYYLQNDPAWSSQNIGHSSYTMGGAGCLVTCAASAISFLDAPVTPGELNELLTANDGYDGADLLWYKLNAANPKIDYVYQRVFSAATLENDLKNGRLPAVKVKMHGMGAIHWVLVVGAKDGDFLVMDPLCQDKKLVPLSEHGAVFAYRAFVRAAA